jgi:hypothetical protein
MPDIGRASGQIATGNFGEALRIEQAELDSRRITREQREIDALLCPGGAQWARRA